MYCLLLFIFVNNFLTPTQDGVKPITSFTLSERTLVWKSLNEFMTNNIAISSLTWHTDFGERRTRN